MKYASLLVLTFSTCFATAQTVTLSEDFENGIPSTWAIAKMDTHTVNQQVAEFDPAWISVAEPADTANMVAGATSYFAQNGQANRFLILPKLTMAAYGNILQWRARSQDPSYPDSYQIVVSTTDSLPGSFTDTVFRVFFESEDWTTRQVVLSDSGYVNQDIYVAFNLFSVNAYKLYIDDVNMRVEDPLSLIETELIEVNLYPNPASATLTVRSSSPVLRTEIITLSGQPILVSEADQIDVSALNAGIYLARVTTLDGVATKRFVKR